MKTILVIFMVAIRIIFLPLTLLDYLVFQWPVENRAKRWRKEIKIGDRCYFINMMNEPTYGTVERLFDSGEVGIRTTSATIPTERTSLYPAKDGE
jgi:hypothetical protein